MNRYALIRCIIEASRRLSHYGGDLTFLRARSGKRRTQLDNLPGTLHKFGESFERATHFAFFDAKIYKVQRFKGAKGPLATLWYFASWRLFVKVRRSQSVLWAPHRRNNKLDIDDWPASP